MRFPAKKNAGCPKAPRDFSPRKDGILYPRVGLSWDSPPSPAESVRTDGRTYVRTELNNAERSAVRNAGDRGRTRLGDWAGLAGYLKWPVFVGFSRTVNNPIG